MRSGAEHVDEIATRHNAVAVVRAGEATPTVDFYKTLVIASAPNASPEPIRVVLPKLFSCFRENHEIKEVYVRPAATSSSTSDGTHFEPFERHHLFLSGQWAIVARRRHPYHDPRMVGVMLAKDEADILPDVLAPLFPALSTLCFYAPDKATRDAVFSSSPSGKAHLLPAPPVMVRDGYRQALLEKARELADQEGDLRTMWVMGIQGDEVYQDDWMHSIRLAEYERATVMNAQVPTFILHESQRETWDWSLPLEQRLTHYIWGGSEHAGFLDFPWVHYRPLEHMRAHPHGLYPGQWASMRPVRRHYPFRHPEQARQRIEDRIQSGWQPNYARYQDVFMKDEASGYPVRRYWGWFGEAEGVW